MAGWQDGSEESWIFVRSKISHVVVVAMLVWANTQQPTAILVEINYGLETHIVLNNAPSSFGPCVKQRYERKHAMICNLLRFDAF